MSASQGLYQSVLNSLDEGVYFTNADRVITFWSKGAEKITGLTAEEVLGRACSEDILKHINDEGTRLCIGLCPLAKTLADGAVRDSKVFLHHKNGHRVPVSVRVIPIYDTFQQVIGAVEIFTDNSLKSNEALKIKALAKIAYFDTMTELVNKQYTEIRIETMLDEMNKSSLPFGLLFMNITGFKELNDTYGNAVGDKILKTVAKTLITNVESPNLVGRWLGARFVILMPNTKKSLLLLFANKLKALILQSNISVGQAVITLDVAIGGTVSRRNEKAAVLIERAEELLRENESSSENSISIDLDE